MLLKVVFFGGKGGVGKSTLACATALKLSERGNTLLVSIDPAHSLSGILGLKVGESLKKIKENLFAIELNGEKLVEDYANKVLSVLGELMPSVKSGLLEYTKYLKHSPTALETAILDRIGDYLEREFSFVIVDSAPTGQIIRLFYTLNNLQGWFSFLERVAKEKQKVDAFMGREDKVFNLVRERKEKVERLIKTLKEKAILFAVANEEPLSLEEAKSLENSLKDFRVYKVINKWKSMEGNYLRVSYLESPYGIEKLYSMELEDILKVILMEA